MHKNQVLRPWLSLRRTCCVEQTVSQTSFTVLLLTLIYSNTVSKLHFSRENILSNVGSAPGRFCKWRYANPLLLLPRDATQSAVMRSYVHCPSVTIRYRDQIGWNSSKIISRPNSLRLMRSLTPKWAMWCNGITETSPKLGWNRVRA